ncbi:hypothetical protein DA792_17185 [Celeribacter baekdonensis]|uniref:Uncharacterized protein n=1 Tax=Celeribacter baekdonensis TaxID=875171 RepID=A0A2R4M691_9RHOB|nr:hypothetical protein DA792_17185 [Celeribacter baekdonensis]
MFNASAKSDLERENASISSENGEELKLQEFTSKDGSRAIGFRYDNPDADGRLWRTELVISGQLDDSDFSILRVRTQCIAQSSTALIEQPRKPFIIKALIQEGKAGDDGYFSISDKAQFLDETAASVQVAAEIVSGAASFHLPIVYVSCENNNKHALSREQIGKLAYDLGGVAHIVVEPSRDFSIRVRDLVAGANVYGGSVGVYAPGSPRGRKFYVGGAIKNAHELFSWIFEYCYDLRSRLPAKGWDWTELQEQAYRRQRERDRNRLSVKETEELYTQEIEALKERIKELEARALMVASSFIGNETNSSQWNQDLFVMDIMEIYEGETSDRLQYLIKAALQAAEMYGLDGRTKAVARQLLEKTCDPKK